MTQVLVVTAVPAERDAVVAAFTAGAAREHLLPGGLAVHRCTGPGELVVDVVAAGVGPAAAAAGTATALTAAALRAAPADAARPYDLVVSAGIGGGFTGADAAGGPAAGAPAGAPVGSAVVADAIVAADLGAQTPDGFLSVTQLGFGRDVHLPPPDLVAALTAASGARAGAVLTGSTVTGSAARAAELAARHPQALAEAMEGFGVAEAAAAYGLPVAEIRTVSNPVGPRDRAAWRIGDALAALTHTFTALPRALTTWRTP
ncbi:futalosine hydrolase [Streptomyces sp. NPDC059740]|uniref:futalosine hydrolase n=1 Tax=Streptomyces sp. NPDC059740 TaxID=3346926 RepID=UPI0036643121